MLFLLYSLIVYSAVALQYLPTSISVLGIYGTMCVLSICCLLGAIFIIFFVPETKGKSFDEIQAIMEKWTAFSFFKMKLSLNWTIIVNDEVVSKCSGNNKIYRLWSWVFSLILCLHRNAFFSVYSINLQITNWVCLLLIDAVDCCVL